MTEVQHPEDHTALEMVRLGYACDDPTDERRCLHFSAGFNTLDGAIAAVEAIGSYNEFDGTTVAQVLRELPSGAIGPPRVSVGREGSPVIYVSQFDAADVPRAIEVLRAAHADEVDEVIGGGPAGNFGRTVRAWWD